MLVGAMNRERGHLLRSGGRRDERPEDVAKERRDNWDSTSHPIAKRYRRNHRGVRPHGPHRSRAAARPRERVGRPSLEKRKRDRRAWRRVLHAVEIEDERAIAAHVIDGRLIEPGRRAGGAGEGWVADRERE